jgi:hypothetical protein
MVKKGWLMTQPLAGKDAGPIVLELRYPPGRRK